MKYAIDWVRLHIKLCLNIADASEIFSKGESDD